jgi:hypothetical protein
MICKKLREGKVRPKGEGHSMWNGGCELFGVRIVSGVYVQYVPDFDLVLFQ